jgi:hypothetical protein
MFGMESATRAPGLAQGFPLRDPLTGGITIVAEPPATTGPSLADIFRAGVSALMGEGDTTSPSSRALVDRGQQETGAPEADVQRGTRRARLRKKNEQSRRSGK